MNRMLSLFDYTGTWPGEFAKSNQWDVLLWDLKHGQNIKDLDSVETCLDMFDDVNALLVAQPCTDFANSGARWFKRKDEDGTTEASMELVRCTLKLVDLFRPTDPDYDGQFFWALENPVGRIGTLFPELGDPWYWDPWEFAGHLDLSESDHNELDRLRRKDGKGITAEEREFVIRCNAYTKKTGLWGEFNRNLERKPVEPVKCNKYGSPMMSYGGDTDKTKEIRSNTPEGFSRAFYEANCEFTWTDNIIDVYV